MSAARTKSAASKADSESASELITQRITSMTDWRGKTLARVRQLIQQADPQVVEELKWVKPSNPGVPCWSHDGLICTGEVYKNAVKLTFARGASLNDPAHLFNSSLEAGVRRAIDMHEGETLDAAAFKQLIKDAVALNMQGKKR